MSLWWRMPARASHTLLKKPAGGKPESWCASCGRARSGIWWSALRVAARMVARATRGPTLLLQGAQSQLTAGWNRSRGRGSHVAGPAGRAREVAVVGRDDDLDGGAAAVDAEVPPRQVDRGHPARSRGEWESVDERN